MKRAIGIALILVLALSGVGRAELEQPFRALTGAQITAEMGVGWNLGNTMDGHSGFTPSETCWQPTITSQLLVNAVHDAGFNTMRLPVTWGNMIDDENDYKINEDWLARVRDIADYAVKQDMYVIINMHHDGAEQMGWLRIAHQGEELDIVKAKFGAAWTQIALEFRDYDEHIIFESMNEVVGSDASPEGVLRDYRTIEALNQIFVDVVRATGGNNQRRWLLCPARHTNIVNTLNPDYGFKLPNDPMNAGAPKLMLSVHDYDYSFGILDNMGATYWGQEKALALSKNMEKLKSEYVDKGIPVVLGEYGAVNKNNTANRAYYYEAMCRMCFMCGVVPCAWDIGWYDRTKSPDYTFSLFDRTTGEKLFPGVTDAIMRGFFSPLSGNLRRNILKIERAEGENVPVIAPFESIAFENNEIVLRSGEYAFIEATALPANSQDVIIYTTSDFNIATVYAGYIHAKAPGTAVISARAQSGAAEAQMNVRVEPASVYTPITDIILTQTEYNLQPNDAIWLSPTLAPAAHTDIVYFASQDDNVATVNVLGRLITVGAGETTIMITTASGLERAIPVTVGGATKTTSAPIEIGIGIYYNDNAHGLYGTETGERLTISGDGEYSLTFNCRAHLSAKAQKAGVTDLTGVGAIYLYDIAGAAGALKSCDIHYESIIVDGKPLALIDHAPKSALKANGKLDTNDPINAWDGSVVEGVTVSNHTVTLPDIESPKQITITFTLSNWQYAE